MTGCLNSDLAGQKVRAGKKSSSEFGLGLQGPQRLRSNSSMAFAALFLVSLVLLPRPLPAFNVDVDSKVVHEGPAGSCPNRKCMFGFSVAQHREQGTPWLLVGAPEAETGQPGIREGGAVFKCRPDTPGSCEIIPFDKKGNAVATTSQQYDQKSHQWFGSLVRSSGDDGVILACAPRYLWFTQNRARREPVGTCYTAKNDFQEFVEYSPCRTRKWGYHRQGSCQAGIGGAIAENGEQVFIGAPGSWYWQGQMFSQSLLEVRDQHKTGEGSPDDDDSYLGYSVTTGEFNGDGDNADVAVGMPRGADLKGKVLIYNSNLTDPYHLDIPGQIGAYFGYSLASGDLNGDGLDDLIVGSPMWTDYEVEGKYETGRVYVVYQDVNHQFRKFDTLDGQVHKARFGLSVACAGNLNLDGRTRDTPKGIEDLIVGAPYDGDDNRGAVYIFLGSQDGVVKKPAQVIHASDISSSVKTFGWSLSGGMDLDQNQYPDLLVGAYDTGNAVYLRSAPVVHMDAKVNFRLAEEQLDLDQLNCRLRDGKRVPCVDVEIVMKYDGVGVPDMLDLELQYLLDAKKENLKRMFFLKKEGQASRNRTITMRKGKVFKDSFSVYVLYQGSSVHDKLTNLVAQVHYSLKDQSRSRTGRSLKPVLGQFDKMASDFLSIKKDCGDDLLCIPNLSVDASHMGSYVSGSGEKLELTVAIKNAGELAFGAMLYLTLPPGVNYINANSSDARVSVLRGLPLTPGSNNTLEFEVGNPFPKYSEAEVSIFLEPKENNLDVFFDEYVFFLAVNSSNKEKGQDNQDNQRVIRIPLEVSTDWRVTGTSKPGQVEYNISAPLPDKYEHEEQLGEEVTHIYDVKNRGPSTIQEAEVYILWPSFNEDGEHLLYLLNVLAETVGGEAGQGKAVCQKVENINPLYVDTIHGSAGHASAQSGSFGNGRVSSGSGGISGSGGLNRGYNKESTYSTNQAGSRGAGESYSYEENSSSSHRESTYGSSGGSHGASGGSRGSSGGSRGSSVGSRGSSGGSATSAQGSYGSRESNVYESSSANRGSNVAGSAGYDGQGANTRVEEEVYNEKAAGNTQRGSYDYERRYESERGYEQRGSSSSGSVSGTSNTRGGGYDYNRGTGYYGGREESRGTVATSGWKLLDNGTYIQIYDTQNTGRGRGRGSSSGGGSGRESGVAGTGHSDSSDSGWVLQPDGTYLRKKASWSSWSSESGGSGGRDGGAGGVSYGNRGTSYGREEHAYGSSEGSHSYGTSGGSYGSESSSRGSGSSHRGSAHVGTDSASNTDTIFNAARGPGNYHGTISKTELEREAGGPVFSSTGEETIHQIENTRYQGSGSYGQSGSSGRDQYGSRGSSSSGSASESSYSSGQDSYGSSSSSSSSNQVSSENTGSSSSETTSERGKWVWSEENNKWEWLETSGSVSGSESQRGSQDNQETGDSGSSDSGWITHPNGTRSRDQASWSSWSSSSGSQPPIVDESYASAKARGAVGGQSGRGSYNNQAGGYGYNRQSQSGSRQNSGREYHSQSSGYDSQGSDRGYGSQQGGSGYFESGHIGSGNSNEAGGGSSSGSQDSGWVLLDNGTYIRRESQWSSHSESSYGNANLNQDNYNNARRRGQAANEVDHGHETGDHGKNTTGWVRQPDGTLVRKSSSWASWSKTSGNADALDRDHLKHIQSQLEHQARARLDHPMDHPMDQVPSNVEPGFENSYQNDQRSPQTRTRRKRSDDYLDDFEAELSDCESGRCTPIRCKVGPLAMNESVVFKIRSRLFTKTQIENYADKVRIYSKLVTRITKLPYQTDPRKTSFQVHHVTTEVFPSEMAEGSIPWWVWLLAALLGLLLLALIIFCLYKCGFFKRKRPSNSPERQPLSSGNGYH